MPYDPNTDLFTLEPSGVADVTYSLDHTRIYAALRNGDIEVFDKVSHQKVATWHIGTSLGAISLSEDGTFLLAVERQPASGQSIVYKINATTGVSQTLADPGAAAFRDVEIVDAHTALITGGQPQVTVLNLDNNSFSPLAGAVSYSNYSIMVEDKHLTLLAEPGISDGPLFLYDDRLSRITASGDDYQSPATGFNFGSQAVSEAAGRVVQFIYYQTINVYDLNLHYLSNFAVGERVDGLTFDSTGHFLYAYLIDSGYVAKYDTSTWTKIEQYYVGPSQWHNDLGYGDQLLLDETNGYLTVLDADASIGNLRLVHLVDQTFFGTGGADHFAGGTGNDIYYVDNAGDTVTENPGEGIDEVRTSLASYALGANVENLTGIAAGGQSLRGNGLDNVVIGGAGDDLLYLQDGGNDRAEGREGDDGLYFGASLTSLDTVDGGAGSDTLALQGNYSGLTLGGVSNVEVLLLASGANGSFGDVAGNSYSYDIKTVDVNIPAGGLLTVIAGSPAAGQPGLQAGENLSFDGSAETNGAFAIFAGSGTDHLIGGAGSDGFFFGADGNFTGADRVEGGGGDDSLALRGNYSGATAVVMGAQSMTGIEHLVLLSGHNATYGGPLAANGYDYSVTMADANVSAGTQLDVNGAGLGADESLVFDGRAETNGSYRVLAGAGDDDLRGGSGADTLYGGMGADRLEGGAGADTFLYRSAAESTGVHFDTLVGFDSREDRLDLPNTVGAISAATSHGTLSAASFDANLAAAIGNSLGSGQALLFAANGGDFNGRTFLIVDGDGQAGYQAGHDFVFEIVAPPVQPSGDFFV